MVRVRRPAVVAASVAVIVAAVAVALLVGGSAPVQGRGSLAGAVASMPRTATTVSFTDWKYAFSHYDRTKASQRDLVTRSVALDDTAGLKSRLGLDWRDISWEVFGQWPQGEASVLRVDGPLPSAPRLRKSGFRLKDGIWTATGRLAAQEPIYASLAVLPRDGVVVMGRGVGAVAGVRDVVIGRAPSLAEEADVAGVTQALDGVQTAFIQRYGLGCEATKVGVEPERARQAKAAEERFGKVVPYSVLGRGIVDDRDPVQEFRVAMTFESAAVAAKQAGIRAALSAGPFLGRSGDMSDVLRLRSWKSDGQVATLSYDHPADSEYLMTGQGPLMPASC